MDRLPRQHHLILPVGLASASLPRFCAYRIRINPPGRRPIMPPGLPARTQTLTSSDITIRLLSRAGVQQPFSRIVV